MPRSLGSLFLQLSPLIILIGCCQPQSGHGMSDTSDVNLTPSVEEFGGWYNIQGDYGDGHPVLRSMEPMPEFEHGEIFELYPKAAKWFDQLVTARPNIPFDPEPNILTTLLIAGTVAPLVRHRQSTEVTAGRR